MRSIINWAALLYFVWLVANAFSLPSAFIDFLIVGALPGTSINVPAGTMLTIFSILTGLFLLELASRHIAIIYQVRKHLSRLGNQRSHLPQRRFSRI